MSNSLNDPRWQKLRLQVMDRDKWSCVACGCSTKPLHVHHIAYSGEPWEVDMEDLQTLCDRCHSEIGKHPMGGAYYSTAFDVEYGNIVMLSFKHCPICGCTSQDCHSGCVIFTCKCSIIDLPKSFQESFFLQGDNKHGHPSYFCSVRNEHFQ